MSTEKLKTDQIQSYVTGERQDIYWRYERPRNPGAKMLLLTTGGSLVVGQWTGELGEAFIAWSPMIKRDRVREAEIELLIRDRVQAKIEAREKRMAEWKAAQESDDAQTT